MKNWLRNWLGITDIVTNQQVLYNEHSLLHSKIDRTNKSLDVISPGLSRVIAKLDAKFAEPELSPERKAESDRIGKEALKRLKAEALARAPYNET